MIYIICIPSAPCSLLNEWTLSISVLFRVQIHQRLIGLFKQGLALGNYVVSEIRIWSRRGCNPMVVGFTTTCAIRAYHH